MSGPDVISIIVNVAALIDYSSRLLNRVDDFSGKVKVVPNAFREVNNTLPSLAIVIRRTQSRVNVVGVDKETYAALLPLVTDFQAQLEELKTIFDNTLPQDGDKWFKIWRKAAKSVQKDKKVDRILVAIHRYVGILTMTFAEAADHASRDLLSISGIMSNALISMRANKHLDEPSSQKSIYLIDATERTHLIPITFCQTAKGLVIFLMFAFRDCPAAGLKKRVEDGEFWLVDCNGEHFVDQGRKIRPRSAILANSWEENVRPGKSFAMIAEDDLKPEERDLVHKTWQEHIGNSLPEILRLADWETSKVEEHRSVAGYLEKSNLYTTI